jgi:precorrin-4/cobalt-precorrin-4 C11-methyltransferase
VQTIILTRISGRASAVPESEELASLAAHKASLCLYLSASHIKEAQDKLLEHYPGDTPVAVCFRVGWEDEKIWLVPLAEMAALTETEKLIRTTLYIISPALGARLSLSEGLLNSGAGVGKEIARSRLYHPEHSHLFRPSPKRQ